MSCEYAHKEAKKRLEPSVCTLAPDALQISHPTNRFHRMDFADIVSLQIDLIHTPLVKRTTNRRNALTEQL